jgi:thiamine-phosphate pyrophosphorylase
VNDSVEAAILSGADGVHLGQSDDVLYGLKRKRDGFTVGYSTHTLSEVVKANDLPVDYIGFGPVFKTGTKIQKYGEVFDIVNEAVKLSNHSVVFIGGINKRNIESLPCGDKIFYAMVSGLDEII